MPGLARKLLIYAAVDGLLIQPLIHKNQRAAPAARVDYAKHDVVPVPIERQEKNPLSPSFESYGIVGLLSVASTAFLICITRRQQVAQIRGKAIYVVTDVALIPLSSQDEAQATIIQTRDGLKKQAKATDKGELVTDSDASDDEREPSVLASDDEVPDDDPAISIQSAEVSASKQESPKAAHERSSNVAEDVIGKKGQYGRFAERWFSKRGWSVEKRRMQGMSANDPSSPPPDSDASKPEEPADNVEAGYDGINENFLVKKLFPSKPKEALAEPQSADAKDVAYTLMPKLLRTTKMLLASSSYFFSYDYDITRSFANQNHKGSDLPLYKTVDPLFFWNHHILTPFIEANQDPLILPLMQGFVGQRAFTVGNTPEGANDAVLAVKEDIEDIISTQDGASDSKPSGPDSMPNTRDFLMTLISRRSTKRAGLRYLRRGIDDEGHTANSVETEQVLSSSAWGPGEKIYSFVQFRGSIPVYFSQSPYSFKPVPVLQHSPDTNYAAFKKHFVDLAGRYGGVQVASLVDKKGNEAQVGEEYENNVQKLNENGGIDGASIGFEWFDFHTVCRGMKFENVSLLMDSLGEKLNEFGKTVEQDGKLLKKQAGILRTNCMDCLDRTNVVQSGCGRSALESQLKEEGFTIDLQLDKTTQWFNTLWADNGDSISKQYSSTAALKGDYTRTRQRNYKGAINDFGLTLSRYFNNIVNDYFSQAAIDYLLGNVTAQVFDEFEADMMSGDPAMSMRKVRQNAIDTSAKIVIADAKEELLGGWTLSCPHEQNTLRSFPFEECILILTDKALYACRFDWNLEKVSSFERVDLRHVVGLRFGTYITSTLTAAQMDEDRNVGFAFRYLPGKEDVVRVNTRSLKNTYVKSDEGKILSGDELVEATAAPKMDPDVTKEKEKVVKEDNVQGKKTMERILAFKALTSRSSIVDNDEEILGEKEIIKSIIEDIERAFRTNSENNESRGEKEEDDGNEDLLIVEEADLIGVAEARKSTGLLEQLGYSLKRLVWA
ncbi:MAG: hypothetical protein M1812_002053 [Candelaria pacifica]|nr:MAG: hypothetical protein M1812_002053 [Candelaria pacifica]